MIPNESDSGNRTKRFLARFYIALYYTNFKVKDYKIMPHENLRTILRHTVHILNQQENNIHTCPVFDYEVWDLSVIGFPLF